MVIRERKVRIMEIAKKYKYDSILDLPVQERTEVLSAVTDEYCLLDPFGNATARLIMNSTVNDLAGYGISVNYDGPFVFKTVFFADGPSAAAVRDILQAHGSHAAVSYMLTHGSTSVPLEASDEEPGGPNAVRRICDDGYIIVSRNEDGVVELIQAQGAASEKHHSLLKTILGHRFI